MTKFECCDIDVFDDETGERVYSGPKFLRCKDESCLRLVTHGQIAKGGCICGMRKLKVCMRLTGAEKDGLRAGRYPLTEWEKKYIRVGLKNLKEGWGDV